MAFLNANENFKYRDEVSKNTSNAEWEVKTEDGEAFSWDYGKLMNYEFLLSCSFFHVVLFFRQHEVSCGSNFFPPFFLPKTLCFAQKFQLKVNIHDSYLKSVKLQ